MGKASQVVGKRIREIRKSLDLKQVDLSEKIGISGSRLSDIERGKIVPTLPILQKISDALNRPMEYFIAETVSASRILSVVIPRSLIGKQALAKFAELIAEKTNGELAVQFYQHAMPNHVHQQVKGLAEGSIHIFLDDLLSFEHFASLCGIAFLPYFFRDRSHYHAFLQSPLFDQQIYSKLLANGIRILNPTSGWEYSSFELLFSNYPVFQPADLKNRRFRSYESGPADRLRQLLQALPVQVLWGKGYNALKQNEVDVFLVPAAYSAALRLHEVASYATLIDYGYTQNLVCAINEHVFQTLPPDMQKVIFLAIEETGTYFSEVVQQQTDTNLEKLSREYKIPVIHPAPEIWREAFSAALHSLCQDTDLLSAELYAELTAFMIEANIEANPQRSSGR